MTNTSEPGKANIMTEPADILEGTRAVSRDTTLAPLTGAGIALALLLGPWIPFQAGPVPALAAPLAVFLGTVRLRGSRVAWLGSRASLVAAAAALLATAFPVIAGNLLITRLAFILELPSVVETPGILAFIGLVSLQGAWFALLFQRQMGRKFFAFPQHPSLLNPRTWREVGTVGVTISLLTGTVAVWLVVVALPTFEGHGPVGPWAVLIALVLGLVALLGLLGPAVAGAQSRLASH